MSSNTSIDSILVGAETSGGTLYVRVPNPARPTCVAYEVRSGGSLGNPRQVEGEPTNANWRN